MADPLMEESPEVSPYCYALDNPLSIVDPTGMIPDTVKQEPPPGGNVILSEIVVEAPRIVDNVIEIPWVSIAPAAYPVAAFVVAEAALTVFFTSDVNKSEKEFIKEQKERAKQEEVKQNEKANEKRKPASEKFAKKVADKVQKDLGIKAAEELHDDKENYGRERTKQEILEKAWELYEHAGKIAPAWMR